MPGGLQQGPGSPVPSRAPRVAAPEGRGEISAKCAQIGPAAWQPDELKSLQPGCN